MRCCTTWPRMMWAGLLFLCLPTHIGCATTPLDWWRRETRAADGGGVPTSSEFAQSSSSLGPQALVSSPGREPLAAPSGPGGEVESRSGISVPQTQGTGGTPEIWTRERAYRDWETQPSANSRPDNSRPDAIQEGSWQPEEGDGAPYHFTATGYAAAQESDASPTSGPFFPDSVPVIQANDPVRGGPARQPVSITVEPFEPARILARVGSEVILAGDVLGPVNQALAPYEGKVTEDQMAQQRELLVRQQLQTVIESKLMYIAFLRQIPDKSLSAAVPQIWQQVHKKFDEDELPQAMERAQVKTAQELDAKLREYGWSIAKQRRTYGERALGMEGALQSIDRNPEVTHLEMLDYYEDRADQYALTASARWEQLTIRFDRVANRREAYERIVRMGNEIVLGGAPFWAVAQRDSHDIQAQEGGVHGWTQQGSLASRPLDRAIFALPIGQLSEIIEDERGVHIIRVLERREAGRVPFTDAQVEIKRKIQGEKRQKQFAAYTERLRREIPVWTIYDDEEDEEDGQPGRN